MEDLNKALGEETIAADLLRNDVNRLEMKVSQLQFDNDNLKQRLVESEKRGIQTILQEMINEAVINMDLPDKSTVEDMIYSEVEDKFDDKEDEIINKVISRIVSRLEH